MWAAREAFRPSRKMGKLTVLAMLMCGTPQLPLPLACHYTNQCVCSPKGCHWIMVCNDGRVVPSRDDGKNRVPLQ